MKDTLQNIRFLKEWDLMLPRSLMMVWRKVWWTFSQRSHQWQSQEQFRRNNNQTRRLSWDELKNERERKNGVKIVIWINFADNEETIRAIYGVKWSQWRLIGGFKACLSLPYLQLYPNIDLLSTQSIQKMESSIACWTLLAILFSIYLAVDSWDQSSPDYNGGW